MENTEVKKIREGIKVEQYLNKSRRIAKLVVDGIDLTQYACKVSHEIEHGVTISTITLKLLNPDIHIIHE